MQNIWSNDLKKLKNLHGKKHVEIYWHVSKNTHIYYHCAGFPDMEKTYNTLFVVHWGQL